MNIGAAPVFTSVTHGPTNDCCQANARLKETLENYNFGAFLVEKSCHMCPNDNCNTSFLLILYHREFLRLKNQVFFDIRPTILIHTSFREIIESDRRIRLALLGENSIGVQVGSDMVNKYVDASPPSSNSFCQTDFKVWKKDTGDQTENVTRKDGESQWTLDDHNLSFTSVHQSDSEPVEINRATKSVATETVVSALRTIEVQLDEEDDEVIFVEVRPRAERIGTTAEVKREPPEAVVTSVSPPVPSLVLAPFAEPFPIDREMKQEPGEEVAALPLSSQPVVTAVPPLVLRDSTPSSLKRVFNSTMVSPMSSTSNSTSFYTPSTTSTSGIECSPASSGKRQKLSEVEMCQMCWDVSYFTPLEDYCAHVLEMHTSISRFKCKICGRKFPGSLAANYHARSHMHPGEGDMPEENSDSIICSEVSEESLQKFIKSALQCYPDKFRNVSHQEIAEILNKHP